MIALDPKTTALVLIDLQNGILGRKLEPISAEKLIERGKALARRFRAAGALVVLVNVAPAADERRVDEPSALPKTLPHGFIDLLPGLAEPGDLKITKKSWGAFSVPELDLKSASAACARSPLAASRPNSASNPPPGRRGISATNSSSSRTPRPASRLKPTTIRCVGSFRGSRA